VRSIEATGQPGVEMICTRVTCLGLRRPPLPYRDWHLEPIVMNALSERFVVEVLAEGGRWRQEYSRGVPTTPLALVGPDAGTGTTLTFWPDPDIFKGDRSFCFTSLRERLREVACLFSGPSIRIRDHGSEPALECRFEPGMDLRDLLELHSRGTLPVHPSI